MAQRSAKPSPSRSPTASAPQRGSPEPMRLDVFGISVLLLEENGALATPVLVKIVMLLSVDPVVLAENTARSNRESPLKSARALPARAARFERPEATVVLVNDAPLPLLR